MRKVVIESDQPTLLSGWLAKAFPALSRTDAAALLAGKDIKVNGQRVKGNVELSPGDEVTLYLPDRKLDGPPLEVLWHSPAVVVAVKPAGVLSKAEGEADMETHVSQWLARQREPSDAMACHRLDSGTGGLMIFARSVVAETAVREMMEQGKIRKSYRCVVRGRPMPDRAVLTAWLVKDAARAVVSVHDKPMPNGRTAVTEYTVQKSDGDRSLLSVTLHTGRTHQIRAHMAHLGHPILGDDKYGDRAFNRQHKARRQMLWACKIEFLFSKEECPLLSDLAGVVLETHAPFENELWIH